MIVNPGNQTVIAVPVDPVAVAVRGHSNVVRSDIPPVQSGEGVLYTRGRPTDDEDVQLVYSVKRKPARDEDQEGGENAGRDDRRGGRDAPDPDALELDASPDAREVSPPTHEDLSLVSMAALPPEDSSIVAQMRQRHLPVGVEHAGPMPSDDVSAVDSVRVIPGSTFNASYKPRDPEPVSLKILV